MGDPIAEKLEAMTATLTRDREAIEAKQAAIEARQKELDTAYETVKTDREAFAREMKEMVEKTKAEHSARLRAVEQRETELQRNHIRAIGDEVQRRSLQLDMPQADIDKYSLAKLMRGIALGKPEKICPHEWDVSKQTMLANSEEVARRAEEGMDGARTMSSLVDSQGAALIPAIISDRFTPVLYANSVVDKIGATQMSGLTAFPLVFNRQTSSTTAYRHGETVAPTASDVAFGQLTARPHKVSAYNKMSEELVKWTNPAAAELTMRDMMQTIALKMDLDFFEGSGASSTPLGVLNNAGVTRTQVNGGTAAALTWDDFITLQGYLADNNALIDDGSLAYVCRPDVLRKLLVATSSTPFIYGPSGYRAVGDGKSLLAPHPIGMTTQLTTNLASPSGGDYLFFGRWSDTVHCMWGGLEIKRSNIASDGTNHGFTEDWEFLKVSAWDDDVVLRSTSITYADDVQN